MKTKIDKDSRNLLIAMLLGDGTISNNFVFKLSHAIEQKEYLEWKIKQLNNHGLRNNGIKSYICTSGYNIGREVIYSQLNIIPFVKLLRRIFYKPKKIINNRQILNRLNPMGIAIWYMDDGHINIQKRKDGSVKGFAIKIATCQSKENNQVIIDYFKDVWDINFYQFSEGRNTFSIACGANQARKFMEIVKPYVLEIPSMWYKIRNDKTKEEFNSSLVGSNTEIPDPNLFWEDMV